MKKSKMQKTPISVSTASIAEIFASHESIPKTRYFGSHKHPIFGPYAITLTNNNLDNFKVLVDNAYHSKDYQYPVLGQRNDKTRAYDALGFYLVEMFRQETYNKEKKRYKDSFIAFLLEKCSLLLTTLQGPKQIPSLALLCFTSNIRALIGSKDFNYNEDFHLIAFPAIEGVKSQVYFEKNNSIFELLFANFFKFISEMPESHQQHAYNYLKENIECLVDCMTQSRLGLNKLTQGINNLWTLYEHYNTKACKEYTAIQRNVLMKIIGFIARSFKEKNTLGFHKDNNPDYPFTSTLWYTILRHSFITNKMFWVQNKNKNEILFTIWYLKKNCIPHFDKIEDKHLKKRILYLLIQIYGAYNEELELIETIIHYCNADFTTKSQRYSVISQYKKRLVSLKKLENPENLENLENPEQQLAAIKVALKDQQDTQEQQPVHSSTFFVIEAAGITPTRPPIVHSDQQPLDTFDEKECRKTDICMQ